MEDYNQTQKNLVENAERAHFYGIRHKGLSGTVCEDLLIEALRQSIPSVQFDRGVINFGGRKPANDEPVKSSDLSKQIDIIIYRGQNLYKIAGVAVVHIDDVLGVIESTKWGTQKKIDGLAVLERRLTQESARDIGAFFVAFRFHDRKRGDNWFVRIKHLPRSIRGYCFAGEYGRHKGKNLYPWQESWAENFADCPYAGQYQKFVEAIEELSARNGRF
jgi:hypothetical protein